MKKERENMPPESNVVIAWINGKVIMINPSDNSDEQKLYYDYMKREYVTIGEHLPEAELKPLSLLSLAEQEEVYEALEGSGGG